MTRHNAILTDASGYSRSMCALTAAWLALSVAGCGPGGDNQAPGEFPSPIRDLAVRRQRLDPVAEARTRGRETYMHYCQICHGDTGQGDGFNSTNLAVAPRDFSDPEFWKSSTDERLTSAIADGGEAVGKSVLMPAWGKTLSQQQIDDVIAYLPTIPEQVKPAETASAPPK
ncbi:MAG: cytochrome c [Planctomycetes bacterium]|nr:cytochrome c [Planctomycetota bacterium]